MSGGRILTASDALAFLLAGNARITLVSLKTGARFTYRVVLSAEAAGVEPSRHNVQLLTGPENEIDYRHLGTIFGANSYGHGRKSSITRDTPSALAFLWTFPALVNGRIPETVEVWHEGKCGRCGRALTVPASIASGIGPECARKMGRAA